MRGRNHSILIGWYVPQRSGRRNSRLRAVSPSGGTTPFVTTLLLGRIECFHLCGKSFVIIPSDHFNGDHALANVFGDKFPMASARGPVAAASGQLQNKRVARWNDLFALAVEGLAAAKVDSAWRAGAAAPAAAGGMVDAVEEREDGKGRIPGVGNLDDLAQAAPEFPGAA